MYVVTEHEGGTQNVPQVDPEQPVPLADHFTPLGSFVVAAGDKACVIASAARLGETETVIPVATMVRVKLTDLFWAGVPESVTWKVSGVPFTAAVGVPVIAPLEAFNARPTGSVPLVSAHL